MITLSRENLINILRNQVGATFVTIVARTSPKMYAKNPFATAGIEVIKVSSVNGTINFVYENAVNNQRSREDLDMDFQAFPRKWGQRLFDGNRCLPLVEHKGEYYLELKIQKSLGYHYENAATGEIIDTELVNPHLYQPGPSRQGVEREIILRDYKIANVMTIKLHGNEYSLAA